MLSFALVARKVQLTHHCFGYIWIAVAQPQCCLPRFPPTTTKGLSKILWEDKKCHPKLTKEIFHTSVIEPKNREPGRGREAFITMFAFGSNHHVFWSSASQEVAEHCLLMHFAHTHANFCFCFRKLPYLNLWTVFHLIFSAHPAGTGSGRVAWWALESPARVNPPQAQGNKNLEFKADMYASLLFKIYSRTFSKAT